MVVLPCRVARRTEALARAALRSCVSVRPIRLLATIAMATVLFPGQAAEIRIGTFNTESGPDTLPVKVAETIREVRGVDIWALQEVESPVALERYAEAAKVSGGGRWTWVIGRSGAYTAPDRKPDRLGILYRRDMFREIETIEYHAIRSTPSDAAYGRSVPALLGAMFLRLLHGRSKTEFYLGNVHLKCCDDGADIRTHQSKLLASWIERAGVPVILVGDFNIPLNPQHPNGNTNSRAYRELTVGADLLWLRPVNAYETVCDPRYDSMLDHVYHTRGFLDDTATAQVQFADAAYCEGDAQGYSDHRPVIALFQFPSR